MTDDPLADAARWCVRLAEVLGDVGRRAAALGELVGRDWPDLGDEEEDRHGAIHVVRAQPRG